jgi:chorismate mutase/prephenate dehydratase
VEYSIENLRERINSIDEKLVALFEERMETVAEIAEYKKRHGMSIIDPERENEVVKNAVSRLKNKELKDYVTFFKSKGTY